MTDEIALTFPCAGDLLFGVLHRSNGQSERGVLVIVGGPQYRIGSHRQFVLLARALARTGVPVLRFDYRGMGDSGGELRTFEAIEMDIRAAVDAFFREVPQLQEVVLWGLCDAASAAIFYAHSDRRVSGLVLVNPWVRTDEGIAKAYLQHYYVRRFFAPALWRKIGRGEFDLRASWRSLAKSLLAVSARFRRTSAAVADAGKSVVPPLPERMLEGIRHFEGRILIILCGDDLTAQEFKSVAGSHSGWRKALATSRVTRRELAEANHTFSRAAWRDRVIAWSSEWLGSW